MPNGIGNFLGQMAMQGQPQQDVRQLQQLMQLLGGLRR
jgi:hypothetical protein